jgi:hypothetical protein
MNLLRVPISHLRSSPYRRTAPVLDATSGLLDNDFFTASERIVGMGMGADCRHRSRRLLTPPAVPSRRAGARAVRHRQSSFFSP